MAAPPQLYLAKLSLIRFPLAASPVLRTRQMKGRANRRMPPGFAGAAADGVAKSEQAGDVAKTKMRGTHVGRSAFMTVNMHFCLKAQNLVLGKRPNQSLTSRCEF